MMNNLIRATLIAKESTVAKFVSHKKVAKLQKKEAGAAAALAAREARGKLNGAQILSQIASAVDIEYQAIFDAQIVPKSIKKIKH